MSYQARAVKRTRAKTSRNDENFPGIRVLHLASRCISADIDVLGRIGRTVDVAGLLWDGPGGWKLLQDGRARGGTSGRRFRRGLVRHGWFWSRRNTFDGEAFRRRRRGPFYRHRMPGVNDIARP